MLTNVQAEGDAGRPSVLPTGEHSSSGQEFTAECRANNEPNQPPGLNCEAFTVSEISLSSEMIWVQMFYVCFFCEHLTTKLPKTKLDA